jgi:ANTAR domain/GAF domain
VLSTRESEYAELAITFAEISQLLFEDRTVQGTLQRIVNFANTTIDGCDAASISTKVGDEFVTSVYSDEIASDIDQFQYKFNEGPCLDAARDDSLQYAPDLINDPRWPRFGPEAVKHGMKSLLACRLTAEKTFGSLNLYARSADAYDSLGRTKAVIFAAHAGVALRSVGDLHDVTSQLNVEMARAANLEGAIASRQLIGQAEGILIERERITADEAYEILKKTSQHLNLKLRNVAQYVVETGEVPEVS